MPPELVSTVDSGVDSGQASDKRNDTTTTKLSTAGCKRPPTRKRRDSKTGEAGSSNRRVAPEGLGLRRFAGEAAPLTGADSGAGVTRHEGDHGWVHHAEVLPHDASITAARMLYDDSSLEYGTYPDGLTGHNGVEPTADLVVQGGDDSREWN